MCRPVELRLARLEAVDDVRVELAAAAAEDLLHGGVPADRLAVRALVGHPRRASRRAAKIRAPNGMALLGEAVWVPGSVPALVMGTDNAPAFLVEERDMGEQPLAESPACCSIRRRFLRGQASGL